MDVATAGQVPRARDDRYRVLWLDGIRGAAALFVVLHHMFLQTWNTFPVNTGPWWLGWLLYGHMAVAVFIVVSGFSLALVPLRRGGRLSGGAQHFFSRRAWRILPAYWAALVISILVTAVLLRPELGAVAAAKSLRVHGVLVQDVVGSESPNGALWSIAIEWQIYFVFPLILLLARRTTLAAAVAATGVVVILAHGLASAGGPLEKINGLTPQFLALFAFGVLAVQVGRRDDVWRYRRPLALGAVAFTALFVVLAAVRGTTWVAGHFFLMDLVFGTGVACLLALMYAGGAGHVRAVLASRTGIFLGLFSYSIYLLHDPVVGLLSKYALDPLGVSPFATFALFLAIGLPVVLTVCYGFHLMFEAPFLRRRDLGALREMPGVRLLAQRSRGAEADEPVAPPVVASAAAPAPPMG
jgi:peptidoglycan/LPS O-acetylase OafA/YrhL